jgi:hypothetical protein
MPAHPDHYHGQHRTLPRSLSHGGHAAEGAYLPSGGGILLHARDVALLPNLLTALPGDECHLALTDASFRSLVWGFRVSILGARQLDSELRSWLRKHLPGIQGRTLILALEHPGAVERRDVVVTSLAALQQVTVQVLSAEDDPGKLLDRLLSSCAARALRNPTAARAIALIRAAAGGIGTVEQLASRMRMQAWALRYHWRTTVGEHPPLRWLMDVVRLCEAVSGSDRGTLFQAALRMGVHRKTLERLAQRYTGHSLRRLRNSPGPLSDLLLRAGIELNPRVAPCNPHTALTVTRDRPR